VIVRIAPFYFGKENKLCAESGKSADSGREADFFIPNPFCVPSTYQVHMNL
jgi:hypothetical protein